MKKPTAKEYREAEYNLISCHAPRTFPCGKCKWPVMDGFVCGYCKDENPYHDKQGQGRMLARAHRRHSVAIGKTRSTSARDR